MKAFKDIEKGTKLEDEYGVWEVTKVLDGYVEVSRMRNGRIDGKIMYSDGIKKCRIV